MFKFSKRLGYVKVRLKDWHRRSSYERDREKKEVEKLVEDIQEEIEKECLSLDRSLREVEAFRTLDSLLQEKEEIWHMKCRRLWLKVGDNNSSFFQKASI